MQSHPSGPPLQLQSPTSAPLCSYSLIPCVSHTHNAGPPRSPPLCPPPLHFNASPQTPSHPLPSTIHPLASRPPCPLSPLYLTRHNGLPLSLPPLCPSTWPATMASLSPYPPSAPLPGPPQWPPSLPTPPPPLYLARHNGLPLSLPPLRPFTWHATMASLSPYPPSAPLPGPPRWPRWHP